MNVKKAEHRILVDTNVLISAVISSPLSISRRCINHILEHYRLLICSYTVEEMFRVISCKFPKYQAVWDELLSGMDFELAYTPKNLEVSMPIIRDAKDMPIIVSAIIHQPDMIISSDKDFHTLEIQDLFPVYTPADFLHTYYHPENLLFYVPGIDSDAVNQEIAVSREDQDKIQPS